MTASSANRTRIGPERDRRARIGFGIANVGVAIFVSVGVFRLLPTRWWVVDSGAVVVATLLGASGLALLRRHRFAEPLTRVASGIVLVLGLALFAAIALTASWISGVYSQVGKSGAIIFGLVAALVLPYVVVLPAVELAWLGPRKRPNKADAEGEAQSEAQHQARREGEAQSESVAPPASKDERKKKGGKKGKRSRNESAWGARGAKPLERDRS
jgi:hypothetical protein